MSLVRQQQRRDTTANWVLYNPVLLDGELGLDTTQNRFKVGDGLSTWDALPYADQLEGKATRRINAADFGFLPTATAAENDAAIAAALASGRAVEVTGYGYDNPYHISVPIVVSDLRSFVGDGQVHIVQDTDTADIVRLGGAKITFGGMTLKHLTLPSNTQGNGIVCNDLYFSHLFDIEIVNARVSFGRGTGTFFSNQVDTLLINGYYESGIKFVNPGNTGSVLNNVYVNNQPYGTPLVSTGPAVRLQGWNDSVWNQLNIEHTRTTDGRAIILQDMSNIVINGLHFEDVGLLGYDSQMLEAYGNTSAVINGLICVYADISPSTGDGGAGRTFLTAGGGAKMVVTGIGNYGNSNTKAGAARFARTRDSGSVIWLAGGITREVWATADSGDVRSYLDTGTGLALKAHTVRRYKSGGPFPLTTPYQDYQVPLTSYTEVAGTNVSPLVGAEGSNEVVSGFRAVVAGVYQPSGYVAFIGGALAARYVEVKVNGTGRSRSQDVFADGRTMTVPSNPLILAAGDIVTVWAYAETSGVTLLGEYGEGTAVALTYLGSA